MEILGLTFQLGVFFAIYGFIWFFIDLGIKFITSGAVKSELSNYLVKGVKYLFLVNVIFLFSVSDTEVKIELRALVPVMLILFLYFVGKFQKNQNKNIFLSRMGIQSNAVQFNSRYEMVLIMLSLLVFILFILEPSIAQNNIAKWFKVTIIDIETTAIIGFIFKIIGFFFLLDILTKTMNAFQFIIARIVSKAPSKNKDKFDDFEEVE
ncbi:MAG: hypothetical protein L7U23_10705 [Crocinitomicaceae bacterium]|nr:hypothetical protein [Crocinitomicaceae bacterium]